MSNSANYIILNGSCIPEEEAMIPAVTSGLYYGAGCFETFLAESGTIFKFDDHIARLNKGLDFLGASEAGMVNAEIILDQIKTLLHENDLLKECARIRIQVSLGEKNGYSGKGDSSTIVIITGKSARKNSSPKKLILSETSVVSSSARPTDLKLCNTLHYRQAFREAEQKGVDDAIMITEKGFVAESSIANIFFMKDEVIYTPSEDCDILPGIMRNSIIEILKNEMNYDIEEGRFSMDELLKANIVWLTNSIKEIAQVSQIEKISFGIDDPFLSDLKNMLNAYKEKHSTHV